jgi:hypothetical protein
VWMWVLYSAESVYGYGMVRFWGGCLLDESISVSGFSICGAGDSSETSNAVDIEFSSARRYSTVQDYEGAGSTCHGNFVQIIFR